MRWRILVCTGLLFVTTGLFSKVSSTQQGKQNCGERLPHMSPASRSEALRLSLFVEEDVSLLIGEKREAVDELQRLLRAATLRIPEREADDDRHERTSREGNVELLREDFEGVFPSGNWNVFDCDSTMHGEYYWGRDDSKPHQGSHSAWCAAGGANGCDPTSDDYPNDACSYMVNGPFDLSDAGGAHLNFYFWMDTEDDADSFMWFVLRGDSLFGTITSGKTGGWISQNEDLSSFAERNFLGAPQIFVGFVFLSNGNNTNKGVFLDDILVNKTASEPDIAVSPDTLAFQVAGEVRCAGSRSKIQGEAYRGQGDPSFKRLSADGVEGVISSLTSVQKQSPPSSVHFRIDSDQSDTLIYDDGTPAGTYHWGAGAKMASRMSPVDACQIVAIQIFCHHAQTYKVGLYDWTGSAPGAELFETGLVSASDQGWNTTDIASQTITVTGEFVASFNMVDTVAALGFDPSNNGRAWDYNGSSWSSWDETYFIRAIVAYAGGVPDTIGTMVVRNTGGVDLVVSDITTSQGWITSIEPRAFTAAAGGTEHVTVTVSTVGLPLGMYYGFLNISSNDPDENPYVEPVRLEVYGGGAPRMVVSPDTLFFSLGPASLKSSPRKCATVRKSDGVDGLKLGAAVSISIMDSNFPGTNGCLGGEADTLSNLFELPFYCFNDEWQTYYEATRLVPSRACTLKAIFVSFYNYESLARSKSCEFYVWDDGNDRPGSALWTVVETISLPADEAGWIVRDVSEKALVLEGAFWVGHREMAAGAPSSLADTIVTVGANYYSSDGSSWEEDSYDYLHMAAVAYAEEISGEEDAATMTIRNTGEGILEVSRISCNQSWVQSIVPASFLVVPQNSQLVTITVSSAGLERGRYDGILHIVSNDPIAPEYQEPLVFDITQVGVEEDGSVSFVPQACALSQNSPNPFNPETHIEYQIGEGESPVHTTLAVYNVLGRKVGTLVDEIQASGHYTVTWDGRDNAGHELPSGLYFFMLKAGHFTATKKMVLLK